MQLSLLARKLYSSALSAASRKRLFRLWMMSSRKKASTFQTLDELKADVRSKLEKSAAERAESDNEAALQQASI